MKAQSRTVNDDKPDREVGLEPSRVRIANRPIEVTRPSLAAVRTCVTRLTGIGQGMMGFGFGLTRLRYSQFGRDGGPGRAGSGRPPGPGVGPRASRIRIRESRRGPRASEVLYMMECMNICLCLESQQPLPKGQGPGCVRSCTDAKPPRWPRVWMHSSDAHNVNGMLT